MTTTTTEPRKINERWLEKRRELLGITRKTGEDGQPNPAYVALEAEITAAAAELARFEAVAKWVRDTYGLSLNRYPYKVGDQTYDENQVFMGKNKTTGKATYLTRALAWERYCNAQETASV